MTMPTPRELVTLAVLMAATIGLAGCSSMSKPASASFASVRIRGHTAEQIRATTALVFEQDGFSAVRVQRGEMIFEKEGSKWDSIAYGSWVDNTPVWVRVKLSVVPLAEADYRLQCQAYKVRNKGDPLIEDEVRVGNAHKKPYQALLDKVLGQLKRQP
jgi:hypothetical protein